MTQYSGVFSLQQQGQALTSGQWCTDPYFKNTTLLLHADNVSGSAQNNTFVDSSTNGFAITRNGNTTQGSFTPYGPDWSNYFDGSSYLTTSSNPVPTTGDFTVEMWLYSTGANVHVFGYGASNGFLIQINSSGYVLFGQYGVGTYASSTLLPLNQFVHIAVVRNGSSWVLYQNGVSVATATWNPTFANSAPTIAGGSGGGVSNVTGYISNLRLVNTATVYTTGFAPSTTPLTAISGTQLLTCQANRFLDASSNAYTFTLSGTPSVQRFSPFAPQYQYTPAVIGGSGYFDGSGDYLTAPDNAAFELGTSDFTIEGWFLPLLASRPFVSKDQNENVNYGNLVFGVNGSGVPFLLCNPNSGNATDRVTLTATSSVLGSWNHVAATRSGSTWRIFVNGVLQNTATSTVGYRDSSSLFYVGCTLNSNNPTDFYQGHMCDVRLVKGTAVYTSTFTPPTAPLTAISNTSFLLNFTNAGIYDNAMMNDLETVGNAQVSTNVVKYGSGSLAFDGSGDYLLVPMTSTIGIPASSAFTYECWIYLTAAQANYRMLSSDSGGTTTYVAVNSTGIEAQFGGLSSTLASCTYSFSTGTWYHLALVRNSSNAVVFYVNGVAQTMTNGTQSNAFLYQGSSLYIGRWVGATPYEWYGYIDDLRITKGVARYTANFQPPKVAFANQ